MKILGIDPGSRITGFGLIEANKLKFSYINSGCIRTKGDLNDRIITIYEGIKEIIDKHEVDIVVVERVFMRPGVGHAFNLLLHSKMLLKK